MTRYRGLVWRHVPVGAEPLHLGYILKATRGRWNTRRPRLPCLYTALTPEGAIAELDKHAAAVAAFCRALARREVLHGRYDAILAPSAALRGSVNLMIYTVRTGHIHELANGPDRVTVTPGYRWLRLTP